MTARQLFYDEGKPAATAKPVVQAKQTPPRAAPTTRPSATTRPAPPKPEVVAKADVPKKAATPASPATTPSTITPATRPVQVPMLAVSHTPVAVRYSLVKLENGAEVEVPVTHTFRSGDQVRLKVEANQRGYLYLIARGSSGVWKPLFPSREASDNVVEARRGYDVPSSTQAFTFDDQEGREKIFLVFSRVPLSDLDSQIDNLRNRPAAAPSHAEPPPEGPRHARPEPERPPRRGHARDVQPRPHHRNRRCQKACLRAAHLGPRRAPPGERRVRRLHLARRRCPCRGRH
ncbi:MAG: DUF4384 domain-containing protein [Bryobacterales bacterium]|nr:DUF4384 domain-containing protein [Bryobacterales bacterium]